MQKPNTHFTILEIVLHNVLSRSVGDIADTTEKPKNMFIHGAKKCADKKEMELVGVGYRASSNGQVLELSLGYSHAIYFKLPPEVKVEAKTERNKNPLIMLESCDKQLLGQVCAKIRSLRKPEPYKGKGIKFVGEVIRRKSGKSASAK